MDFTTRPELKGTYGVVSSTHWLASQSAMAILERGGNAFDAAVAGGLVLQVVEPHLNGLGGDLPILLWDASRARPEVICGQGPAPAGASIAAVRALGLSDIPGSGLVAACVPGAFGGWMTLLRDHGTMRVRDVLEFAIGYAEAGYPLLPRIVSVIEMVEPLFREHWRSSGSVYLADGLPRPWQLFRNPDLAATYRRLVAGGQTREAEIEGALKAFYSGFVAEAIERHCRTPMMDSSGSAHPGLLTASDMAAFTARHEQPVTCDFRGRWTVAKCGPWSQGPVFLQQLRLLEAADLGARDFLSSEHVHLVTECAKLAFADREAWYADPGFADVPLDALLSAEYAAARARLVGDGASLELRPGSPNGRSPHLPERDAQQITPGHWTGGGAQSVGVTRGDTCHIAVADRHGNLVACTPSGGWLQSSPVIEGLGFCLGTRAQMFNLDPEHPNRIEGRKRPRTTLSPSLALLDGEPRLAFGTPGGDQQDQWTLEFLLAHALFGHGLQAAIDAPMFHTSHFPSSFAPHDAHPGRLHSEPMQAGVLDELLRRGHEIVEAEAWTLGRTCVVGRNPESGVLEAAANPRGGQAYAVGR
ncbi:MAG TPA: gamma-glutamyltransferase family protein [Candidatus Dormibacteraeota bacterium]|nr:gamma-glutamyltransferase family protein [Candidatus Dormibacteraeota bacterium]